MSESAVARRRPAAIAGESSGGDRQTRHVHATMWPQGVSHVATMTIGQVLAMLKTEFPAVSISKLRFLEEQELVLPTRTATGYRKYSQADVERLRFILTAQRDHYWPLRVIRSKLAALDQNVAEGKQTPHVVPPNRPAAGSGAGLTQDELRELTGVNAELLTQMAACGLLPLHRDGLIDSAAIQVVEALGDLAGHGITPRHLRLVAGSVGKQAELVERAVAAVSTGGAVGRGRALVQADDIAGTLIKLESALLHGLVRSSLE